MRLKNISYKELQKEVFLLEHGFYDGEVTKFIQENPSTIMGGDVTSIQFCGITYNSNEKRTYPVLYVGLKQGESRDIVTNTDHMNNHQGEEMLIRARKKYFRDKYHLEGK